MTYHFSRKLRVSFDAAVDAVTAALQREGFGILTEIDIRQTLKDKLDVDFRNYRILGACNPPLAHQALACEDKVGMMLPCNVIVQELEYGEVEVSAIDPVASLRAIDNPALRGIADALQFKLQRMIEGL